jgi:hypothetical protein
MRIESSWAREPRPKRRLWLQSLLLLGFLICLISGLLALGALWWLYETPLASQSNPRLSVLQTERIVPQLALMHLAGDANEALAYQALNAGELETSRALLSVGVEQMSSARVALIIKLAQLFAMEEQFSQAQQLYQSAQALTILDISLTPVQRSQTLLSCVTGLLALKEQDAALNAAQQILLIAKQVPDWLPAQRSQLLRDLQKVTLPFHETTFAQELNELVRNPYLEPDTTLLSGQWPILAEEPAMDATLAALLAERQQAARVLAGRLLQVPQTDAEVERQLLIRTLLLEDQQRTTYFYQISSTQNLTFSLQFWNLQQQRDWLLIKLAVAQRAYGIPLVAEWETEQTAILQALTTVNADLHQALLSLAQSQPSVQEQLTQRFYALTWLAQQVEFGFYPQDRAVEIGEQLGVLQREFGQLGITPALPVAYVADATPPGFRIVTAISR